MYVDVFVKGFIMRYMELKMMTLFYTFMEVPERAVWIL